MNWGDERYVRIYTRDTTDWLLWSWQARAVFVELCRKVDRAGVLEFGARGPKAIAAHLRIPWEVVEPALGELTESGTVEIRDGALVVINFLEAQEAIKSDRARQKDSRNRRREHVGVTKRDRKSRPVTDGHEKSRVSQNVTPSLAVLSLAVPSQEGLRAEAAQPVLIAQEALKAEAPKQPTPVRRATDEFQRRYVERTGGSKPTWDGKAIKLMRDLVEQHGPDEVIRRVGVLFDSPPRFLADGTPDVGTLKAHFDKLAPSTPARDVRTGHAQPGKPEDFSGGEVPM